MSWSSTQLSRQRWLIVIALGVLAVYAILNVRDARSAYWRLQQARGDLTEIQQKLGQIEQLRRAPRVAALDLETPDEIVNRVAAALESAGLPQSALSDQTSSEPQRVQRSDFKLRSITIKLQPATLPQIVRFCDALRDEDTGTTVRDLTLTEPTGRANAASRPTGGSYAGQEKWEAELTLTQMIFSPTSS